MTKQLKLPIMLVLLNALGGILLGLGLVDYFGDIKIVPQVFRIENYQFILIFAGILLELPFIVYLVNFTLGKLPRDI